MSEPTGSCKVFSCYELKNWQSQKELVRNYFSIEAQNWGSVRDLQPSETSKDEMLVVLALCLL
jgi:hypothetical protein